MPSCRPIRGPACFPCAIRADLPVAAQQPSSDVQRRSRVSEAGHRSDVLAELGGSGAHAASVGEERWDDGGPFISVAVSAVSPPFINSSETVDQRLPISAEQETTNLNCGPGSRVFCLLEIRLRGAESRNRIQERLSRTESAQGRVVPPQGSLDFLDHHHRLRERLSRKIVVSCSVAVGSPAWPALERCHGDRQGIMLFLRSYKDAYVSSRPKMADMTAVTPGGDRRNGTADRRSKETRGSLWRLYVDLFMRFLYSRRQGTRSGTASRSGVTERSVCFTVRRAARNRPFASTTCYRA